VGLEPALRERILRAVDDEAALDLLRRAVRTPSVTGDELAFGELVASELRAAGLDEVHTDEVAPGRPNVWGLSGGEVAAPSLAFLGHLDTVHARGWSERWEGDPREDPFAGVVVDGELWGRGAADVKAGIAAALAALRALRDAGLRPRGTLVCAFVPDEESGEPGSGRSDGMKALLPQLASGALPRPDLAVYVEPTRLQVYPAQIGFLIAEIAIHGRSAYFGTPELGVDALRAGHALLASLWQHAAELERGPEHPLLGRASLLVTRVEAGGYVAVPGDCRVDLIRKLLPHESLDEAREGIERAVDAAAIDDEVRVELDYPAGRDHPLGGEPFETAGDAAGLAELRDAIKELRPDRGELEGAPFWSELSFLSRLGIPGVYCAPGDIRICHTLEERVPVDEYLDGVRAFALLVAAHCGVTTTGARAHDPNGGIR
jgi:acetylornithine deacetylase